MDTSNALIYTAVVFGCAIIVHFTLVFCFRVRKLIRRRFRASLSSKASAFLVQGFAVMGVLSYFACEIIGNCVISNGFSEEKCDEYARATCIVGFQVSLAWMVQFVLFQTGTLSYYKVLVLDLTTYQWMGAISFILCSLLAMVCYVTKQNSGVPGAFIIVSLCLSFISLIFMGMSIDFDEIPIIQDDKDIPTEDKIYEAVVRCLESIPNQHKFEDSDCFPKGLKFREVLTRYLQASSNTHGSDVGFSESSGTTV